MSDVISLGEALIDFVPAESGVDLADVPRFKRRFGGAPANLAIGLARLGTSVGFIGKVGEDSFGDYIEDKLRLEGVDVSCLFRTTDAHTPLAFVSLTESGDRDFLFYRDPGADELLESVELDTEYIQEAKLFNFGSLSLTGRTSREATRRGIEVAKEDGQVISMDPNLRLSLWPDEDRAVDEVTKFIPETDVLKLSAEEVHILTGEGKIWDGVDRLRDMGPDLVVVTLGPDGYYCNFQGETIQGGGHDVKVRDTTGAGDGFMAGLISSILPKVDMFPDITGRQLQKALDFANATAALTTVDYGATSSFPGFKQVKSFQEDDGR